MAIRRFLAFIIATCIGSVSIAGIPPVIESCRDVYYSPSTVQYPSTPIQPQNVYGVSSSTVPAGELFLEAFVPWPMQIDATDVVSTSSMRFSTDRSGYIAADNGLVFVDRGELYLATAVPGGVEVVIDPDWVANGLRLRSLNAVHEELGCFSFSVETSEFVPGSGWLRPWEVHRKCPGAPMELLFNAISGLSVRDIDALHVEGERIEFSSKSNRYLPGGVRIWNQNTHSCVPSGAARTCAPGDLAQEFDGLGLRLRDLNAFSEGDGVECSGASECSMCSAEGCENVIVEIDVSSEPSCIAPGPLGNICTHSTGTFIDTVGRQADWRLSVSNSNSALGDGWTIRARASEEFLPGSCPAGYEQSCRYPITATGTWTRATTATPFELPVSSTFSAEYLGYGPPSSVLLRGENVTIKPVPQCVCLEDD